IREIFENFPLRTKQKSKEKVIGEIVRFFLLSTHYRSPVDFSDQALHRIRTSLDSFYDLFLRLTEETASNKVTDKEVKKVLKDFPNAFEQAMDDDFNTPAAIAEFHRIRGELNTNLRVGLSQKVKVKAYRTFKRFGKVLGIFQVPVKEWEFEVPTGWMNQGRHTGYPSQAR